MNYLNHIKTQRVGRVETRLNIRIQEVQSLDWSTLLHYTRPDIAYDLRELATKNREASIDDLTKAKKVLKKAQKEDIKIKYSKQENGPIKQKYAYTGASYKNAEDGAKRV